MATTAHHHFPGSLLGALVGILCAGCGSSSSEAMSPDAADSAESSPSDDAPEESEPSPEERKAERSRTLQASCDDGTCFSCGDGVCPVGAYCAAAPDGALACAWVPECPKPSCACVTRALGSSCSCEEQGGAPHVTCR